MDPPLQPATASSDPAESKHDASVLKADHDHAGLHPLVIEQTAKDVLVLLVIFRCINALCVKTFFQPDEYFQSLEPAWQLAFGSDSGAWITWEWHHGLRSSLHPALFAAVYWTANKALQFVQCFPQFKATILSVLPNLLQALFAAWGDYYTWQLAERVYGTNNDSAWAALWMSVFSPWQWFCSTRTFSNCFETTLTIGALYHWPWELTIGSEDDSPVVPDTAVSKHLEESQVTVLSSRSTRRSLRMALLLAALACVLRPTNLLIWFPILMPTIFHMLPGLSALKSHQSIRPNTKDFVIFLLEALFCSAAILIISGFSDRLYFDKWTFPPYQWLTFNISQDLAVFYGRNDWHYYLSQGLPLLLTTYLPFTIASLYRSLSSEVTNSQLQAPFGTLFSTIILTTIVTLSFISHKEVRFIYPLLPLLHIITGPTISFFQSTTSTPMDAPSSSLRATTKTTVRRKPLLILLLALNMLIASYTTLIHQRGVLRVLTFLRHEYEDLALDYRGILLPSPLSTQPPDSPLKSTTYDPSETFVGFLMPCHSTPWRSQLFYPGLKAWALTCEPPLHLAAKTQERERYRDEADRFFDDPKGFLNKEIGGRERPWPRYVVGFEGFEGVLREWYEENVRGWRVKERWRTGNSQWHDDWRRKGDVVVWEFVEGGKD